MNKKALNKLGFTLIELITVMSILGIVLFFVIPEFETFTYFSNSENSINKIILLVKKLKIKAVSENIDYFMHIDSRANKIWISNDSMEIEKLNELKQKSMTYMRIDSVELFNNIKQENEDIKIRFSKYEYSDMAFIHIQDNNNNYVTIKIEPFLSNAEIRNKYISLKDCI
ncbi:MAG: hypothetical protein B6I26_05835 [Desulfobacteraceae bacterium 4572_130]|nr:MAG: hypothetical protein B6I26_05835 [Desulfobacteraceae bacterium 4572_130]